MYIYIYIYIFSRTDWNSRALEKRAQESRASIFGQNNPWCMVFISFKISSELG